MKVLKSGNESAFFNFQFHCPEVNGFLVNFLELRFVVNTSLDIFTFYFTA